MCGLQRLAYARIIAAGHAFRAELAHAGITRARPTCPYTIGTASPSTTSLGRLTQAIADTPGMTRLVRNSATAPAEGCPNSDSPYVEHAGQATP
jgi:hypothetical protein